ncbi:MAG: hypothetical protein NZT92_14145 [Abditibacteriales bacterium]|nr:hypothetical protein [Abditibacteriales bacterium]MDW8367057.1 hypothetical protein [Abditibacteriales bacterium]
MPIEDKEKALRIRRIVLRSTPCDIGQLEFSARGSTIYITGVLRRPPGAREAVDLKAELAHIEDVVRRIPGVLDVIVQNVRFA